MRHVAAWPLPCTAAHPQGWVRVRHSALDAYVSQRAPRQPCGVRMPLRVRPATRRRRAASRRLSFSQALPCPLHKPWARGARVRVHCERDELDPCRGQRRQRDDAATGRWRVDRVESNILGAAVPQRPRRIVLRGSTRTRRLA
eukprot:6917528-Prymnesium_polylepis.1